MIGGKRSAGYTIVEVMIVLAVSGVMFVIASTFVSGKQETTAFSSGVNEMASRIQSLSDQVEDGEFSDIPLTCNAGTITGGSTNASTGVSDSQGTQNQCMFLGKMFKLQTPDLTDYQTVSLIGTRADPATHEPYISLSQVVPREAPQLTTSSDTPQSLNVSKVIWFDAAGTHVFGSGPEFGFLQGLGSTASGTLVSGSQDPILYAFSGTTFQPASKIVICMDDGTRFAEVRLGSNNSARNVTVQMNGKTRSAQC